MKKADTITDSCNSKLNWMPDNLKQEIGHFNVFRTDDFVGKCARPMPYSRKDYFKISLVVGRNKVYYADKTIEIERNAILFANPQVPYAYESLDDSQSGFFCIFTPNFFGELTARLQDYPVFKPAGQPIYFLPDAEVAAISDVFLRMFAEINSDYVYKYDALRNLVFELVHRAQKLQPAVTLYSHSNAAIRISSLFMELLERQFPIESPNQQINLRSASKFAGQLNVHVNHLNRALKETTGKTTSEIVGERIVQEAVALLKHTTWNVAEIAYSLGFEEPAHFNNFFKKRTSRTPTNFRIV